jgi:DNA-directed RNA polymerase
MQTFTGKQYLHIDIANTFGLDRLNWDDRLHWFDNNEPDLEAQAEYARNPVLFRKAVRAWRLVQKKQPTNHIMGLDATASGLQIMAALSGCHATARAVNLVNTGKREDVYDEIAGFMNTIPNIKVNREMVKKPIMTVFYGSTAQPKEVFGEGDALLAFYEAIKQRLTGAYELMQVFQKHWDPHAEFHQWTLPDGHVARVPVLDTIERSLEVDEYGHLRFTYRTQVIKPIPRSRSLAANIVHSLDGWVAREMVKAAKQRNFQLAPIHDCFYASPNHMNEVRQLYAQILTWLTDQNMVVDILSELSGNRVKYQPLSHNLGAEIINAEYHLS